MNDTESKAVEDAIVASAKLEGPLLPLLHAIMDAIGYIPNESIARIAKALNVTRADVEGTVSFYHDFRRTPPGRHVVRICRAEACQSMGSDALAEHAKERLQIDFHETRKDGAVSLEPVYCLGNCACAPAMLVDNRLHGRVTHKRFDEIVKAEVER